MNYWPIVFLDLSYQLLRSKDWPFAIWRSWMALHSFPLPVAQLRLTILVNGGQLFYMPFSQLPHLLTSSSWLMRNLANLRKRGLKRLVPLLEPNQRIKKAFVPFSLYHSNFCFAFIIQLNFSLIEIFFMQFWLVLLLLIWSVLLILPMTFWRVKSKG